MKINIKIKSLKLIDDKIIQYLLEENYLYLKQLFSNDDDFDLIINQYIKFLRNEANKVVVASVNSQILGLLFFSIDNNINKWTDIYSSIPIFDNALYSSNIYMFTKFYASMHSFFKNELISLNNENLVFYINMLVFNHNNKISITNQLIDYFHTYLKNNNFKKYYVLSINNSNDEYYLTKNYQLILQQEFSLNKILNKILVNLVSISLSDESVEPLVDDLSSHIYLLDKPINASKLYIKYYPCKDKRIKKTLVLIHGIASNHATWDRIIDKFDKQYNILVFDLPLHGYNNCLPYNKYNWDIFLYGLLISKYIRLNNYKNIILWGHSMGGGISIVAYLFLKDIVKEIILEDTYNFAAFESYSQAFINSYQMLKKHIKNILVESSVDNHNNKLISMYKHVIDAYKPFNNYVLRMLKSLTYKIFLNYINFATRSIKCPTLVLFGKHDYIVNPEYSINYFKNIDNNFSIKIINNANHTPHNQQPMIVYEYVNKFLNKK